MLWFYESFFPVVWIAFVLYWRIKAADTKTDQRLEPAAQWGFQRPHIEDDAGRPALGQLPQDPVGGAQGRGDEDEIMVERAAAPIGDRAGTPGGVIRSIIVNVVASGCIFGNSGE